jgi:CSLREA domain-containing protein
MSRAGAAVSGLRSLIIPRVAAVVAVGLLVTFLGAVGNRQPTYAATITVDTTDDELNSDGDCSLREAITAANADVAVDGCAAGSGADTIDAPAGTYTLSIAGTLEDANATGDLDVTDDLTISGAGVGSTVIDANVIDRVLDILAGVTAQMFGVTVQGGNTSSDGGGIVNSGTLTLADSEVSGNSASGFGGGIENLEGTVTLANSTVSGNTSGYGGGIDGYLGAVTLTNSTVSDNSANSDGGGIYSESAALTLTNSTVSGNSAGFGGGGIGNLESAVTLTNSIVANSVSGDDCNGTITSNGHNLDSDGTCSLTGPGDLSGVNALLGALMDNGGPTQTHALSPGSPAIDAGAVCPTTDQRGFSRPLDGDGDGTPICDIGAYEAPFGDQDLDTIGDAIETACGANPLDGGSIPERVDGAFAGVDDDGNDGVDEALPAGSGSFDCDGDGYSGSIEDHVYSYAAQTDGDQKTCQEYDGAYPNASADIKPSLRWPSDLNKVQFPLDSFNRISVQDLTSFLAPVYYLGTDVGTNPGDVRWDLLPGPGIFSTDINIQDLTALIAPAAASGAPPMLGGVRALGGPACPWPP